MKIGTESGVLRLIAICLIFLIMISCGDGSSDCIFDSVFADPSGHWEGTLTRTESDCPQTLSAGTSILANHEVSTSCLITHDRENSEIDLIDENGNLFHELISTDLGGGSFTVTHELGSQSQKRALEISYKNLDGKLSDVDLKIKNYIDGKILCSERYQGQVRKTE